MPRTSTIVTIFLASPSDVSPERGVITETVHAWNTRHSRHQGVAFELLKWEDSISAGIGEDGQDVINSQIADEYDLLIAVFWTRVGTSTPRAASGSIEEYERALARFKSGESVDIAFLFKEASIDVRSVDIQQLSKLREFEKSAQAAGALTKSFRDNDGLRLEVNLLLDRLARAMSAKAVKPPSESHVKSTSDRGKGENTDVGDEHVGAIDKGIEESGFLDLVDDLGDKAEVVSKFLTTMTAHLNETSLEAIFVNDKFKNVASVRPLDANDLRPGLDKIASGMDRLSIFFERELNSYKENILGLADDVRDIIRVSYDWIDGSGDVPSHLLELREALSGVVSRMDENTKSQIDMIDSAQTMPRMTSSFNKARRRFIKNVQDVISTTSSGKALLSLAVDELDVLIGAHCNRNPQ